jgi:hypothetical protein
VSGERAEQGSVPRVTGPEDVGGAYESSREVRHGGWMFSSGSGQDFLQLELAERHACQDPPLPAAAQYCNQTHREARGGIDLSCRRQLQAVYGPSLQPRCCA